MSRRRSKRSAVAAIFLRGLGTLLPGVLTAFVFVTIFRFAGDYVTRPINASIYWWLEGTAWGWRELERLEIDPYAEEYLDVDALPLDLQALGTREGYFRSKNFVNQLQLLRGEREGVLRDLEALCIDRRKLRESVHGRVHPLVGTALSALVVFLAGWCLSGFAGRRLVKSMERAAASIPFVRSIYPCAKQLVEFFVAEREIPFETVVAVPYPRNGIWSLGFVTNRAPRSLRTATGKELACVFIPSSPMPMTGYTIMVEVDELVPLPLSVDEALRMTVSGGVLLPPREDEGGGPPSLKLSSPLSDLEEAA